MTTDIQKSDGQTGHTPGPWVFIDATKEASMQYSQNCVIRGSGKQIACFSWQTPSKAFPSKEESQANARLIAAAPDFAGVAPDAADLLDEYSAYIRTVKADELDRHPYLPEIERVASDLRAAIAKATGQ